MSRLYSLAGSLVLALGCGDGGGAGVVDASIDAQPDAHPLGCVPATGTAVRAETIISADAGLVNPLFVTAAPSDPRLFILEQPGRIRVFEDGRLLAAPFLDVTERTNDVGEEMGLLGMAFSPDYASDGRFFVYMNDRQKGEDTAVFEFSVTSDPNIADPASEQIVMPIAQPYFNHNGGMIAFSPADGYLYVGLGDGGNARDPEARAQDPTDLMGSILRLDVGAGSAYSIPPDNPFASSPDGPGDPRPEIWAIGLRNPWRFSFDTDGAMYIGDVGQGVTEEISRLPADAGGGENFGWDCKEGTGDHEPGNCAPGTELIDPIAEYTQNGDEPNGCSVTGGYVYRGTCMPDVQGTYFYADYCTAEVRSFSIAAPVDGPPLVFDPGQDLTSFGEDAYGELYIVLRNGEIARIVPDN